MGWFYSSKGVSKQQLINELEAEYSHAIPAELLQSKLVGSNHWCLVKKQDGTITVSLHLLSKDDGCWGYKPLSEFSDPFHYDCPARWMDELSPTDHESALEWRGKVKQFHKEERQLQVAVKSLKSGGKITFDDKDFRLVRTFGPRKGWGVVEIDNEGVAIGEELLMASKYIRDALRTTIQ